LVAVTLFSIIQRKASLHSLESCWSEHFLVILGFKGNTHGVDNKCIGESAPNVFFYEEVKGNAEHKISTESEFSPNELLLKTESGKNYFIKQYLKLGVFVGGANLEQIDEKEGKKDVSELGMAIKGTCSQ
jgi:hypothetical protein